MYSILPTSIRRVVPLRTTSNAFSVFLGIANVRMKSQPDPRAITAISHEWSAPASTSPLATSETVPSPPTATTS